MTSQSWAVIRAVLMTAAIVLLVIGGLAAMGHVAGHSGLGLIAFGLACWALTQLRVT